jgi:hypothetical protein
MKNTILLSILAILSLVLTGCTGSIPTHETNYHTGTDGITMDLVNKGSLDEIYEDTNFAFSVALENIGAYDVVSESKAIITLGFDPFYIETLNVPNDGITTVGKSNVVVKGIELTGKSKYTPSGGKAFLYFPYFKTKAIEGQRARPDTQLFASICYPYATTLSTLVCVDFDAYQGNERTQVCRQADQSFSSQGGPVAITNVEVENYPAGTFVKPVYTIHINNVGGGTILSPVDNLAEIQRVCAAESIDRTDFNKVKVEAWLSNNIQLECTPDVIRLNADTGIVRCAVKDEDVQTRLSGRQNFQAPLTVNLTYVYMSTLKQDIEIKRINPYGNYSATSQDSTLCEAYQVKVGGKCVSRCEYCATVKSDDPLCNPENLKYDINWNNGFGCKCSAKTCETLYPKGNCMPMTGYCSPATYCCANQCGSNQIRDDKTGGDGTCYPKCSDSCSEIKTKCACGSQDDYSLGLVGQFCSKDGNAYTNKDECDAVNKDILEAAQADV